MFDPNLFQESLRISFLILLKKNDKEGNVLRIPRNSLDSFELDPKERSECHS